MSVSKADQLDNLYRERDALIEAHGEHPETRPLVERIDAQIKKLVTYAGAPPNKRHPWTTPVEDLGLSASEIARLDRRVFALAEGSRPIGRGILAVGVKHPLAHPALLANLELDWDPPGSPRAMYTDNIFRNRYMYKCQLVRSRGHSKQAFSHLELVL